MATPRVFISSTCYDLQEVRFQLKHFIEEFGYEAVLSEFGDIFYDPAMHVQDACLKEIERCNMFILIIGNSYGSFFHKQQEASAVPDSITLQEFRRAIEKEVVKFICINRFVKHDHDNYHRALSRAVGKHFAAHVVPEGGEKEALLEVKRAFDETYPFPQDAYKYVFYFLDIVKEIAPGSAVFTYDNFEDIRAVIRKQWAGMLFESLHSNKQVAMEEVRAIGTRLERIENQLRLLAESKTPEAEPGKFTFDLAKLASDYQAEELDAARELVQSSLKKILGSGTSKRILFRHKTSPEEALRWLTDLGRIVTTFRWSKTVGLNDLFDTIDGWTYYKQLDDVPLSAVADLFLFAGKLSEEEKRALANTIAARFAENFEPPKEPPASAQPPPDEIPF